MAKVTVEVDLSEFDDSDIEEEFERRGLVCDVEPEVEYEVPFELAQSIQKMHEAFYLGKQDEAIRIAKEIASEQTGRML